MALYTYGVKILWFYESDLLADIHFRSFTKRQKLIYCFYCYNLYQ